MSTTTNTNTAAAGSSNSSGLISADAVLANITNRRSHYVLGKDLPISTSRVQDIVKESLKQVPSSFNSQSNRVLVLFGEEHERLWGIVEDVLKPIVPEDKWQPTGDKLAGFKAAAGSVLFFEDQDTVNEYQQKFSIYADKFPTWSTQSSGMLQYAVWTALESENIGANLQHYNPLIDQRVTSTWKLPESWKLTAQLNFGSKKQEAGEKSFKKLEEVYKVFGA